MTSSTHSAGPGGIGGPVAALRSISISLPDLQAAETFFVDTWRLAVVARSPDAIYLRGTGTDHHLLALHWGTTPAVLSVTFRVRSLADLNAIRAQTVTHGGRLVSAPAPVQEPGGGHALVIQDPQGRILRFVHGDLPSKGKRTAPNGLPTWW
jgi:catechol-2,3-dioxygenase